MPRVNSIRSGWRCDCCGELMSDPRAGWVEWVAAEDSKGKPKASGLRLVHCRNVSPRWWEPFGCQYNSRDEFRKNRGIVQGLPLDRFAGPDGLMLLLSLIAERELPVDELVELAKRVQIPRLRSGAGISSRCRDRRSNSARYRIRLLPAVRDPGRAEVGKISNFSEGGRC